jgi:hypothetical protein
MSEWQPIETAPEDVRVIAVTDSGVVGEATYDGVEWFWADDLDRDHAQHMTHWMPLPDPPVRVKL